MHRTFAVKIGLEQAELAPEIKEKALEELRSAREIRSASTSESSMGMGFAEIALSFVVSVGASVAAPRIEALFSRILERYEGTSLIVTEVVDPLEEQSILPSPGSDPVLSEDDEEPLSRSGEEALLHEFDAFICHASEDKRAVVGPLVAELRRRRLRVWVDEVELTIGDSLRRSINSGLSRSRYGIVVLSPNFLRKQWPQRELDGLVSREVAGEKVILPVWHQIDLEGVRGFSPPLADRLASNTAKGIEAVAEDLENAIRAGS